MADIDVRPVRVDEYDALGALTVSAYESLDDGAPLDGYADVLRDVADRAAHAVVLVATGGDGGLLGGVTYVPSPDNPYAEDLRPGEVGIRMLAVAPAAQGRGAGRALVLACIDRARHDRAAGIALHSTRWMQVAHGLYESLGFRRATERDLVVGDGLHLLSFVLEI